MRHSFCILSVTLSCKIIYVVWSTNFPSEIWIFSNHDDETQFRILSVTLSCKIISVVWSTNFPAEIRSFSNHDDETISHPERDSFLQDHFCSMINEFPVWNSKFFKPRWWDTISHPERDFFLRDLFCSMINEFPVWNSKIFKPQWWDTISHPERDSFLRDLFRSEFVALSFPIMMCPIGIMRLL